MIRKTLIASLFLVPFAVGVAPALAEQGESWYLNRTAWQSHFDVHTPGILVYGGPVTQERLAEVDQQYFEPLLFELTVQRVDGR